MTIYAWVNNALSSEISRFDRAGRRLIAGLQAPIEIGSDSAGWRRISGIGDQPSPKDGLYNWRQAETAVPPYYVLLGTTDKFVGEVFDASAYVQEENTTRRLTMDELLAEKNRELEEWLVWYRLQAFLSPLAGPKGWATNHLDSRDVRAQTTHALHDRLADVVIDAKDPSTYWPRDVYYEVIRDSNGQRLLYPLNRDEWGQVAKAAALHQEKMRDSVVDFHNRFDTAHDAGDFDALAAIDVRDRSRWEQVYEGPLSDGVKIVSVAQAANARAHFSE